MILQPSNRIPGMPQWRRGRSVPAGGSSPYLLDGIDNAAHAWSVAANQRAAYSGSAFKVRRSSDSTTQDIGFDGNDLLDVASLESFCSGTDGYIDTLYDQVGSANMSQSTTSLQPKIVSSGTVIKDSGDVPSMLFDGTDDYLSVASGGSITNFPFSIIVFCQPTFGGLLWVGNSGADNVWVATKVGPNMQTSTRNTTFVDARGTTDLTTGPRYCVAGTQASSTSREAWVSGTSEGSGSTSQTFGSMNSMAIGIYNDTTPGDPFDGYISDVFYIGDVVTGTEQTTMASNWE